MTLNPFTQGNEMKPITLETEGRIRHTLVEVQIAIKAWELAVAAFPWDEPKSRAAYARQVALCSAYRRLARYLRCYSFDGRSRKFDVGKNYFRLTRRSA
jgi:hypothetical protein